MAAGFVFAKGFRIIVNGLGVILWENFFPRGHGKKKWLDLARQHVPGNPGDAIPDAMPD
jgi:hypothetical protein